MKKIIVTQNLITEESRGETREFLDIRWSSFLKEAGLLPIALPLGADVTTYFESLNPEGLLLTGGNDLARLNDNDLSRRRDAYERKALSLAIGKKIPVLGVCRGMQFLADHFGMPIRKEERHKGVRHEIVFKEKSRFFTETPLSRMVNSYHSYLVSEVRKPLIAVAETKEGDIEAWEHNTLPIAGILWHPEREEPFVSADIAFFKNFFGGASCKR